MYAFGVRDLSFLDTLPKQIRIKIRIDGFELSSSNTEKNENIIKENKKSKIIKEEKEK